MYAVRVNLLLRKAAVYPIIRETETRAYIGPITDGTELPYDKGRDYLEIGTFLYVKTLMAFDKIMYAIATYGPKIDAIESKAKVDAAKIEQSFNKVLIAQVGR